MTQAKFDQLVELTQSTRKLIAGFMDYLKDSGIRGQKYKGPAGGRPQRGTENRELET